MKRASHEALTVGPSAVSLRQRYRAVIRRGLPRHLPRSLTAATPGVRLAPNRRAKPHTGLVYSVDRLATRAIGEGHPGNGGRILWPRGPRTCGSDCSPTTE